MSPIGLRVVDQADQFIEIEGCLGRFGLGETYISLAVGLAETQLDRVGAGVPSVQPNFEVGDFGHG